jgi:menaquinol-cytochrome c reductase iron-sulfur subunit
MSQDNNNNKITRRKFLSYVVNGIGGLIAASVAVPLIGNFLSPAWKKSQKPTIPIARADQIPVGTPTYIRFEERVPDAWVITTESEGVWVYTKDGKDFILFDPHCTHLRCPYYWDAQSLTFVCPCHGGKFDINGNVIGGPPPRPLDRWQYAIQNGEIVTSGQIMKV